MGGTAFDLESGSVGGFPLVFGFLRVCLAVFGLEGVEGSEGGFLQGFCQGPIG